MLQSRIDSDNRDGVLLDASSDKSVGEVLRVRLLGSDKSLKWTQNDQALEIDFRGVETGVNGYAVEVALSQPTHDRTAGGKVSGQLWSISTSDMIFAAFESVPPMPIMFPGHNSPVAYRNILIRNLAIDSTNKEKNLQQ